MASAIRVSCSSSVVAFTRLTSLFSRLQSWPKEVQFYKGAPLYGDVLLTALDALHEEQLADGLEMDEEGHVVGAARYPF